MDGWGGGDARDVDCHRQFLVMITRVGKRRRVSLASKRGRYQSTICRGSRPVRR